MTGLGTRIQRALIPGVADEGVDQPAFDVVLPIRADGTKPPLFCIHPIVGLAWSYSGLAEHLDRDRPIYGLQSPAFTEDNASYDSVGALAKRYVQEIRGLQPRGPYLLLGWSFGGVLAHAVATQLRAVGEQIAALVLLDSVLDLDDQHASHEIRRTLGELGAATSASDAPLTLADAAAVHDTLTAGTVDLPLQRVQTLVGNANRTPELISQYRPKQLHADIVLLSRPPKTSTNEPAPTRLAADRRREVALLHGRPTPPRDQLRAGLDGKSSARPPRDLHTIASIGGCTCGDCLDQRPSASPDSDHDDVSRPSSC